MTSLNQKKFALAGKLYDQTGSRPSFAVNNKQASPGGKGKLAVAVKQTASPKSSNKFWQNAGGPDTKTGTYSQSNAKLNQKMKNGKFPRGASGKPSLESVANGRNMLLAGNEHNRG